MRSWAGWGSLLVWVAVVGCSSDGGAGDTGDGGQGGGGAGAGAGGQGQGGSEAAGTGGSAGTAPGATAEEACEAYIRTGCKQIGACAPFSLNSTYGDEATCVARLQAECLGRVNLPKQGLTPDKLLTCATAYQALSCKELVSGQLPAECELPGGLPNGSVCGDDNQCQSTQCLFDSGKKCGVCKALQPVGGSCTAQSDCERGLGCSSSKVCVAYKKAGEACDDFCEFGLACFGPDGAKKCGTAPGPGEKCDPAGVTGASSCAISSVAVCDATSKTCKTFKPVPKGDACGAGAGAVYCQGSVCLNGVCQPYTADGEKCGAGIAPCQNPARCLEGRCVLGDYSSCNLGASGPERQERLRGLLLDRAAHRVAARARRLQLALGHATPGAPGETEQGGRGAVGGVARHA